MATILWSDPPPSAVEQVQVLVRKLVGVLGPETLIVDGRPRLVVADDASDARCFERLLADAGSHLAGGECAQTRADLTAALELWRGEPYRELDRAVPALGTLERLTDMRLGAIEDLNTLDLTGNVDYTLVADLRSWVILYPQRPRLWRQLAQALYRCGRQVEALQTVAEARGALDYPDPALARLETAILRQDAALEAGELPPGS